MAVQRSPQQAVVKRKWSAEKSAGPLVLLAEWLQKRLIQHGWPCDYLRDIVRVPLGPEENAHQENDVVAVAFGPYRGRQPLNDEFWDAFDGVLRVVSHEKRLRAYRIGANLYLDGEYHVNKYGVIRPGLMPVPF